MTINIKLSTESISAAIRELETVQDNIERGTHTLVDILTQDGATVAQNMYGGMANVSTVVTEDEGIIIASGEAVGIAEFGAGDDVIPVWFENNPDFPVYPGSYSESDQGSGEYARDKQWHFGGQVYKGVPARMGLLIAKEQIIGTATQIAQEVIRP